MNDVRAQLMKSVEMSGVVIYNRRDELVDAILERFDVTPKPAVTDQHLGMMIQTSLHRAGGVAPNSAYGRALTDQLAAAGLTIVRKEEGK